MWKYVSRRLRETFDRAYSVLDVRKNWSCGAQQAAGSSSDNESPGGRETVKTNVDISKCSGFWFVQCQKTNGSSKSGGQGGNYRKRVRDGEEQETPLEHDLLGAITWSGAIICGWYASQLLCLHRRQYGWENRGQVSKILNIPSRAFHSNFQSYTAFASPVQPSLLTEKALKENFSLGSPPTDIENSDLHAQVRQVNNENEISSQETPKKQSVQDAVADLVTFLGETEFRMGVQSLSLGDFRNAVAHLKLATSHNHPGATFNLGLCYEKGLGVPKNLQRAMECYQIASSMGHSKAIYNLGVFYAQGLGGLQQDYAAARQCFITAAKLGQPDARYALMLDSLSKDDCAGGTILHKSEIENVHKFSTLGI